MELSLSLRTAYFQLLSGSVLHNGSPVPVYDAFVPDSSYPYIILSSQTSVQRDNKTAKIFNATLLVDIVTGSMDMIGRAQSEQIAEQVDNIINPDSNEDITITGYQIGNTTRGSDTDLTNKNDQYYIYRKLMRYEHLINKL